MKEYTFDAQIIAASPHSDKTNSFVKDTMHKIKANSLSERLPRSEKRGIISWVRHLHRPALVVLGLVAATLVSGVVYAAVQFAPALVQLLGKETNQRGATEYSVAGLAACSNMHTPVDRFELKADAPAVSDEDVQKIMQARCEMQWLQAFPGKQWPTYGTNAEWKDGDKIYYARLDGIGKIASISTTKAGIIFGNRTVDHTPPQGETITAFAAGVEVPLSDIKPGDTVFTISRVSETYRKPNIHARTKEDSYLNTTPHEQPQIVGLIAVFKLSLPLVYYTEKQGYLTEIPECMGNPGELCPNTPSIDVYPRAGGEGGINPHAKHAHDDVFREISGTVTELSDDTLTLTTRKGTVYTVTVGDAGFAVYNRDYTGAYTDVDAHVKVGSNAAVRYAQPKNADAKKITKEQVHMVVLQLEGLSPKKSIKPY